MDCFWRRLFPGQISDDPGMAEGLDGASIELEGYALIPIATGFTDTADSTSLHVPSLGLIAADDVVFNGIHPDLGESNAQTRLEWIDALERRNPRRYAGFRVVGAMLGSKQRPPPCRRGDPRRTARLCARPRPVTDHPGSARHARHALPPASAVIRTSGSLRAARSCRRRRACARAPRGARCARSPTAGKLAVHQAPGERRDQGIRALERGLLAARLTDRTTTAPEAEGEGAQGSCGQPVSPAHAGAADRNRSPAPCPLEREIGPILDPRPAPGAQRARSRGGPAVIGAPGFEPGTSPTRTVRATRLRHAPMKTESSWSRSPRPRARAARSGARSAVTSRSSSSSAAQPASPPSR